MKSILGLAVATFLGTSLGASALSLSPGTSVNVDTYVNGVFQVPTYSGTVGEGSDVTVAGYSLYLNEGDGEMDFYLQSDSTLCGFFCGGQSIEFRISGLDFGQSFGIKNEATMFESGSMAINSETSFSMFWTDNEELTFDGDRVFSGTFAGGEVPLPAGMALMLGALGGLGLARRRRKV